MVQFQDPLRDVVEEVPVVGDRDDRARVLLQEPLQPVDGLGIEMVRGLVEQQQVRVLQEQPGERHATLLATGQGRDVGVVRWASKGVHRDVDVALQVPGIGRVDLVLERRLLGPDRVVVGIGFGPLGHDLVVGGDERVDLGDAVHDVALDVLGRVEFGFLAQVADREARREPSFTGEPVIEAGHDLEQARLAGPVRPDDADLGAGEEREADVLEDRPIGRVVAGELVGGVDVFSGHAAKGSGVEGLGPRLHLDGGGLAGSVAGRDGRIGGRERAGDHGPTLSREERDADRGRRVRAAIVAGADHGGHSLVGLGALHHEAW